MKGDTTNAHTAARQAAVACFPRRGPSNGSAVGPWEPGQDREATDDLELATEGEDGTEVHLRARRRRRRLWKVGDISLGRGGGHHSSTNLPLCCFVNIICLTTSLVHAYFALVCLTEIKLFQCERKKKSISPLTDLFTRQHRHRLSASRRFGSF